MRQAVHRFRGFRGHLDRIAEGLVTGWVARPGLSEPCRIGLFTEQGRIAEALAALHRADLAKAGVGQGEHGFEIRLDAAAVRAIRRAGGRFELRLLGRAGLCAWEAGPVVARASLPDAEAPSAAVMPAAPEDRDLAFLLAGPLALLDELAGRLEPTFAPPPRWRRDLLAPRPASGPAAPPATAYLEHVLLRGEGGEAFETPASEPDLRRVLQRLALRNGGQRVPLGAEQIGWLNAVSPDGPAEGGIPPLTRAMRLFLPLVPALAQAGDAGTPEWRKRVLLWWLLEGARDLHLEDCLLPDWLCRWGAAADRYAPVNGQQGAVPSVAPGEADLGPVVAEPASLGPALEALCRALPDLAGQPPQDRLPALLVLAVARPELLWLLPPEALACLDAGEAGSPSALARLLARLGRLPGRGLTRDDYRRILRHRGFDLAARRFLSLTPEGDRLEPMMLALPQPEAAPVDVQLIGPIGKASGLGQAARLSAAALAQGPYSLRAVSLGLDNPTPEDTARGQNDTRLGPARVNLIHLNAEAVPSAFAHLPDVFSEAWNIGYVFWELDSPAPCHALSFDLLDEIWVSSQFGVSVFAPHAGIPVTNVGMCFEPLPPGLAGAAGGEGALRTQMRARGRAVMARHLPLPPEAFVFLVTFDSFSFIERKNPLGAVRAFRKAFPPGAEGSDAVRLVLKTHNRAGAGDPAQAARWAELDRLLAEDPRLALIDETFDYGGLLALLAAADGYVSLHRAEGWGFGMIEAMALGVPVLCTAYSGNMEFCTPETAYLVDWTPVAVGKSDYIFVQDGHRWAEPDLEAAARQMRLLWRDPALRARRAAAAQETVSTEFSPQAIARRYARRLDEILMAKARSG